MLSQVDIPTFLTCNPIYPQEQPGIIYEIVLKFKYRFKYAAILKINAYLVDLLHCLTIIACVTVV